MKQRSKTNNLDQSDKDHLPQKQEVSKKHKSFQSAPFDISIDIVMNQQMEKRNAIRMCIFIACKK